MENANEELSTTEAYNITKRVIEMMTSDYLEALRDSDDPIPSDPIVLIASYGRGVNDNSIIGMSLRIVVEEMGLADKVKASALSTLKKTVARGKISEESKKLASDIISKIEKGEM